MSQGTAPAKSGGMSTMTIVLVIFGVLGLICVGACGVCGYSTYRLGQSAIRMGAAQIHVQTNAQVQDKFGTPLEPALPSATTETSVDYDLSGPKGKGKVHAEFKTGADGLPEATVVKVTAPDGTVIDALAPPAESNVVPEMPDGTDTPDLSTPPDGTTPPDSTDPPEETNM